MCMYLANPAMATGHMHASVPPATMTFASPLRMNRAASPRAWLPVVHAVETQWLGSLKFVMCMRRMQSLGTLS